MCETQGSKTFDKYGAAEKNRTSDPTLTKGVHPTHFATSLAFSIIIYTDFSCNRRFVYQFVYQFFFVKIIEGVYSYYMKWLLLVLFFLCGLVGVVIFFNAENIMHEIIGGVFFVMSSVFLSGYGIMVGIEELKDSLNSQKEQ